MKILLIAPERERKKEEAFLFRLGFLNLPCVAALTPSDCDVRIVDEAHERINLQPKPRWPPGPIRSRRSSAGKGYRW